ncbi:MAG: glycosyltransferase [Lachnospiraceae bacterium]|nr:glycosyltransferase [Lachnospiraceae bacterium]
MNILFVRYGSIYEPDMIDAFQKAGVNVVEIDTRMNGGNVDNEIIMKHVEDGIREHSPMFVYGINFYPVVADICNIYNTLYVSQTVDSPVLTLFSRSVAHPTNRIFMFDREQYERFLSYNRDCIFHLPLASAVDRFDKVIGSITDDDRKRFGSDIAFVGSTYREKDPLASFPDIPDYTKGFVDALVECALKIYGYYPAKDLLVDRIVDDIKNAAGNSFPNYHKLIDSIDTYVVSHEYIASHIAVEERVRTLNELGKHFKVDMYTRGDTSGYDNVNIHSEVSSLIEMPKVFNLSKINLNMTVRSIETGLPLRCFDILGCGGFLMTNYQEEIEDMFVIGRDLETYDSIDELTDKCGYYLSHEEERASIAANGYEKVRSEYTHFHRLNQMLKNGRML